MTFSEAYKKMREGYKVAHEDFHGGYWAWENDTIMIHCWNGTSFDIRETEDVDFTFGFITEGSWSIKNTNE